MERYVDGFVLPVSDDELDAYREMASEAGELWTNTAPSSTSRERATT